MREPAAPIPPPGPLRAEVRYACGHVYAGTVRPADLTAGPLVRLQHQARDIPCHRCGTTPQAAPRA